MLRRFKYLITAALLAAAACGGGEESESRAGAGESYVGPVDGTEALIGLVFNGRQVAGYVTDGSAISIWLGTSEVTDGLAELRSRSGDFEGSVEFYEGGARGEVQIEGAPFSFDAAGAEGEAGVYWDDSSGSGWIVSNDGETKGPGERKGSQVTDPAKEPFTPQ
jgi:hypothetical protein